MARIDTPVTRPCSRCGVLTDFPNKMKKTCDPCQEKNRADAIRRGCERRKKEGRRKKDRRREREEYRSIRSLNHPTPEQNRPKPKPDPVLERELLRGELERFNKILGLGPSGPVKHFQPGVPGFAAMARMYKRRA